MLAQWSKKTGTCVRAQGETSLMITSECVKNGTVTGSHKVTVITITATSECVKNGIVTGGHRLTAITVTATSECVKNRIATG